MWDRCAASNVEHSLAFRSHVPVRSATVPPAARQLRPWVGNVAQLISASVSRRAYRTTDAGSAGKRSFLSRRLAGIAGVGSARRLQDGRPMPLEAWLSAKKGGNG